VSAHEESARLTRAQAVIRRGTLTPQRVSQKPRRTPLFFAAQYRLTSLRLSGNPVLSVLSFIPMFGRATYRSYVFVMAVALLWSVGVGSAHASTTFGPTFFVPAPIAAQKFRPMNMCRTGTQSNAMIAMACSAHCSVAVGLIPLEPTFPVIAPACPLPSVTMVLEDHRDPPDPHPPMPTLRG
jgi:hypothetical protein